MTTKRRVWTLPEEPPVGTVVGPLDAQDLRRWQRSERLAPAGGGHSSWLCVQTFDGCEPDAGGWTHWSWLLGQGPLREYSEPTELADQPTAGHHGEPVFVLRSGLHGPGKPVTLSLHRDETWGGFELRLQEDGCPSWLTAVLQPSDALGLAGELIRIDAGAVSS